MSRAKVYEIFQRGARATQESEAERYSRQTNANAPFRQRRPSRENLPDAGATNAVVPPDKIGAQAQVSEKSRIPPTNVEFGIRLISEQTSHVSYEVDVIIVQGPGDPWIVPNDVNPVNVKAGEDTKAVLTLQGANVTNQAAQPGAVTDKDAKTTAAQVKVWKDRARRCADIVKIARSLKSARVLRFQYPAPPADRERLSLLDTVEEFANQIRAIRPDALDRPIVFIGYDLGITVIEKFLIHCTKDPVLVQSICGLTVGIMFMWESTKQNERSRQGPSYFDIKEPRIAWMQKLPPPYSDINSQKPLESIDTHLKIFRNLHSWHARSRPARPAMALLSMRSDDPEIYIKAVEQIVDSLRTYRLLDAAGRGDEDVIKEMTERGQNINVQDMIGQSALHVAVRQGQVTALIFLLAKYGADVSIQDSENNNALHYTAIYCSDPPTRDRIVRVLVDAGINRDAWDSQGLSARQAALSAGVSEDKLEMKVPLKGPVQNPSTSRESPKPPESSAALQACHDCLATLAEFHLIGGQEKMTLQRSSVYELLYNVESGPEKILEAARATELNGDRPTCTWYHLPVNHLGWIDDLFTKMGITSDPLQYDQHEGGRYWSRYMRPQAHAFDYSKQADLRAPQDDSRAPLRDFVLYMPYLTFERRCDLEEIRKAMADAEEMHFRKWFDAWMSRWRVRRAKSLPVDGDDTESSGKSKEEEDTERTKTTPKSAISEHSTDKDVPLDALQAWDPENGRKELPTTYKVQDPDFEQRQDPLAIEKNLAFGYHMADPAVFHQRRTLDQSHYFMLRDTSKRDKDQVVLRRARDDPKKIPKKEGHPLVMVDQLWIWVIGDVVISSCPQKCMQPGFKLICDVRDQIVHDVQTNKKRSQILNAHDLAGLIIRHCASVFNRRRPETEAGLQLHDMFEEAVGEVADNQMKRFRKFKKHSRVAEKHEKELTELSKDSKHREMLNKIFAINEEIEILDEIKDIRDELNMILRILRDQCSAVSDLLVVLQPEDPNEAPWTPVSPQRVQSWQSKSSAQQLTRIVTREDEDSQTTQAKLKKASEALLRRHRTIDVSIRQRTINANVRDFERMLNQVDSSYNELNHLLDLKQKQANAWEARLSRKGAESGARQSNTIMVFTVATILFGSLSFITALFALDVSAFPDSWELGPVVGYIISISAALSLLFIFIAFQINQLTKMVNQTVGHVINNPESEEKKEKASRHSDHESSDGSDSYESDSSSNISVDTQRPKVRRWNKLSRRAALFLGRAYARHRPSRFRRRSVETTTDYLSD